MKYVSTRGDAPALDFGEALLTGLAVDGGLYVPAGYPERSTAWFDALAGRSYADVATEVIWPFVEGSAIDRDDVGAMVEAAYATFRHPEVVPLRELHDGVHVAELFWGPTLSFKDVALQLVGRLFEHELARTGRTVTVLGATSGDTGSAAIEALRDRAGVELYMLQPAGRVSEVQRRQMTTVDAPNIHNVIVDGTFDDCQDLVKAAFADRAFRDRVGLSAVNSINWARVTAQVVYYVTSAAALATPGKPVSFVVPTGNFGNILAGSVARRMGAPIERLIIASNANDILTRTVATGVMELEEVVPTTSPAMDIQVSSNFERHLFELYGRDGGRLAADLAEFRATGRLALAADVAATLRADFGAGRADDAEATATIAAQFEADGYVADPHTAVGLAVGRRLRAGLAGPLVALACAHPAKFADTVTAATGVEPELPAHLADLLDRPERSTSLPADLAALQDLMSV